MRLRWIQPINHRFIGYGSKLLRYNVRIQQDHSKLAARAPVLVSASAVYWLHVLVQHDVVIEKPQVSEWHPTS